jgi:myo-inositol 2-dehydrogenase / D-chiro-inositol 1-dehydrogenase
VSGDGSSPRLAIVGAGMMARRRGAALRDQGARVVAVASRGGATARSLAADFGCEAAYDDFRRVADARPDAVLVETPHSVQDEIVGWALGQGFHVFVGGPLSATVEGGEAIGRAADAAGRVVEAGFEARYKAAWETARDWVHGGEIGRVVAVRTVALWDGNPASWYYDEAESGGMPVAHLSYCFVNPVRWILGEPTHVSAFASRVRHTEPRHVREETVVATLLFPGQVLAAMTAGYVRPADDGASWTATFLGTEGVVEVQPTEMDGGSVRLLRGGRERRVDCSRAPCAFRAQAAAFLAALTGDDRCRNRPADALGDLRVAEAVSRSARTLATVAL